jgi:hypothetical protein
MQSRISIASCNVLSGGQRDVDCSNTLPGTNSSPFNAMPGMPIITNEYSFFKMVQIL